jgi:hypothetical protein
MAVRLAEAWQRLEPRSPADLGEDELKVLWGEE